MFGVGPCSPYDHVAYPTMFCPTPVVISYLVDEVVDVGSDGHCDPLSDAYVPEDLLCA